MIIIEKIILNLFVIRLIRAKIIASRDYINIALD